LSNCSSELRLLIQQVTNEHQALSIEVDVLIWVWWVLPSQQTI